MVTIGDVLITALLLGIGFAFGHWNGRRVERDEQTLRRSKRWD